MYSPTLLHSSAPNEPTMGIITRQDIYSGKLFCHRHGCALLNPGPKRIGPISEQDRWRAIYEEGVRIGDVGLISDSGDFRTLFNIFRSSDDLVNQVYGVPPGFEPLEFQSTLLLSSNGLHHLENTRVFSRDMQEILLGADGTVPAPYVLPSSSSIPRLTDGRIFDAPRIPVTAGIGFEYQSSSEQGAVLILPEGARREDYTGLRDIRDYTINNGESWYRFVNDQVRMDARNGSLYVITGFDRTSCYQNLAFDSSSRNISISFKFSCPPLPNGDFGSLSFTSSSLPKHEHSPGGSNRGHSLPNLSPFIRGYKIMIRKNLTRYIKPSTVKIMDLANADSGALLYKGSIPSLSSSGSASTSSSLNSSTSAVYSSAPPSTPSTSGSSSRSSRDSDSQSPGALLDLSPTTSYSSIAGDIDSARPGSLSPRGSSIFESDSDSESGVPGFQLHHPSDIINEYILDKCPDTNVAITHDDEWASVWEESDSQFPDKSTLISRMLEKFPSKFRQNSKHDSILGTLMSPTLWRTDPYHASTPRKRKSPETPAIATVALLPDDESKDGSTKMLSSWLDEHPYVDDANKFVSFKRFKPSSDNSLGIDDTRSLSEANSAKMEYRVGHSSATPSPSMTLTEPEPNEENCSKLPYTLPPGPYSPNKPDHHSVASTPSMATSEAHHTSPISQLLNTLGLTREDLRQEMQHLLLNTLGLTREDLRQEMQRHFSRSNSIATSSARPLSHTGSVSLRDVLPSPAPSEPTKTRLPPPTGMSSTDWAAAHQPSPTSASVFPPEVSGIQYGPAFDDFSGSVGTPSSSGSGTLTSSPFHDAIPYDHSTNPSLHHQQHPFPSSSWSSSASAEEIHQLRLQITELEHRHHLDKQRIQALETQMASSGCLPPPSPTFQASWRARTEARTRQFCSLNRAGNSLCAWHDGRRERRIYPPRMAPEGYLNCGCTYQEALFEESLARHSVGSYLPGDSVRMDPALRNPLLRLLQERYGYRDGDFERDPRSGNWVIGEGHERWEEQISRGIVNPRRPQSNDHNR
ncbi:hypothetical protein D9758_017347 [Tetrapyrgos nigripes]|uniref:Uncharacterized protein n=1 Tax=Tetrapyrgos nigripes TaxID=182062 RepID=A0A8H5CA06_9AGAR|nr:hypothetical protein D9758_017347 [Tetrapyrgos nigripes]